VPPIEARLVRDEFVDRLEDAACRAGRLRRVRFSDVWVLTFDVATARIDFRGQFVAMADILCGASTRIGWIRKLK
jgi:hypothetical protein